ncbi:hypothetical protein D3C72_2141500 [compost metagenome]
MQGHDELPSGTIPDGYVAFQVSGKEVLVSRHTDRLYALRMSLFRRYVVDGL